MSKFILRCNEALIIRWGFFEGRENVGLKYKTIIEVKYSANISPESDSGSG